MAHFNDSLWFIPFSVFVGGLIGSPHCMTMCGPIVINFANKRQQLIAYQLGRMIAYSTAGAIVGAFGEAILGHERPLWLSTFSILLISVILIFNGYRAVSGKSLHLSTPQFLNHLSAKIWRFLRLSSLPKIFTASLAGFLTVFLPCGHLYGFLIGAVATGSALKGATFMFAFWLGSTPLLSFGGVWIQKFLKPKINKGQRWAGVFLIIAGLLSLVAFAERAQSYSQQLLDSKSNSQVPHRPSCH